MAVAVARTNSNPMKRVFGIRDFSLLFAGQTTSLLGDQFYTIAIAWLVLKITGDPLALGLVIALATIPGAIFTLIGGAITDRVSPRRVMLLADIIRLFLTVVMALEIFSGALQAGAISYLQKNVTAAELGDAIRSAHTGRMTLSPEAAQVLANAVSQPQIRGNELTERERDVLKGMVDGLNNNEIAGKLVISLGTVKFHISNIFQKLGVDSRVEAVKISIEQKLV